MKPILIDYPNNQILLSSSFAKKAYIANTFEYKQLQSIRRDFPDFSLVTRQFKKNVRQDRHKGLTYDYMHWFIQKYDSENAGCVLCELDKMLDISKAHSVCKRYPTIKRWFLELYPDYARFGMTKEALSEYQSYRSSHINGDINKEVAFLPDQRFLDEAS